MNVSELMINVSKLRRNTGTIFDNGYDSAIQDCIYEIKHYAASVIESAGEKVDHPAHYKREGAMECIDEMVYMFGYKATIDFCKCNAWKYRYRAGMKGNAEDDLKKSDWYVKKAEELLKKSLPVKMLKFDNEDIIAKIEYPNDETGVAYSENSSD